jgi:hypothetical protein
MVEIYLVPNHTLVRRTLRLLQIITVLNILRIDETLCSYMSVGYVVGRVNQIRTDTRTGVNESRDSFISRCSISLRIID